MTAAREQIVVAASRLLEAHGYAATGLNEIVQAAGAPKGSLYYYFPNGKEEIAVEAVRHSAAVMAGRVRHGLRRHPRPADALRVLGYVIAAQIEATGFQAGGPLQAVAVETADTDGALNKACAEAYAGLQATFAEYLQETGLAAAAAEELAEFAVATLEGAIILSRTRHSGDPLRRVAERLARVVQSAVDQ
jgi:TetR/AcrR family transcriptional repressor of lmrAB and yxaGH operons